MELPPPMKVMEQPMSAAAAQGVPGPTVTAGPQLPPLEDILPDVPNRVSMILQWSKYDFLCGGEDVWNQERQHWYAILWYWYVYLA